MRKNRIGAIPEGLIPLIVVGSIISLIVWLICPCVRSEQERTAYFEIETMSKQILPVPLFYKRVHVGNIENANISKDGRVILKAKIRENVGYRFAVGDCIVPHGNTLILTKVMESNKLLTNKDTTRCY